MAKPCKLYITSQVPTKSGTQFDHNQLLDKEIYIYINKYHFQKLSIKYAAIQQRISKFSLLTLIAIKLCSFKF